MTPSPDEMGTAATRAPCNCTQRSPSVTVRRARSRRPRPVASRSRSSTAISSAVSAVTSASVSRVIGDLPRSGSSSRPRVAACKPSWRRQLGDHLRRACARLARRLRGDDERRRPAVAPRRVVRERLVGAEEAGHQLQRPGASPSRARRGPPAYPPRRGRAGTRRRGAARGRPAAARRRMTVLASSSTMLRPLDQYTAVGVWLGRRASISSSFGSAPRTITSTSMSPCRPSPSATRTEAASNASSTPAGTAALQSQAPPGPGHAGSPAASPTGATTRRQS